MMETGSKRLYDFGPSEIVETVGYYRWPFSSSTRDLRGRRMKGSTRAIVLLIGIFLLPVIFIMIPVYLKYKVFADVQYIVTEGDFLEISRGISPIFCEAHSLQLETSVLNAFQIVSLDELNYTRQKYSKLMRENSSLTGDSLQTWSFFLREGSISKLELCSREKGTHIMIVKDAHTCGCGSLSVEELTSIRSGDHFDNETTNSFSHKNSSRTERSTPKCTRSTASQQSTVDFHDEFVAEKLLDLRSCHEGKILLDRPVPETRDCGSGQAKMMMDFEVTEDDNYSFIVYSPTDHTVQLSLEIFKPTFEYGNYRKACLNESYCVFPLTFMSREEVIVEIGTQPGAVNVRAFDGSTFMLQSTCEPRKSVYVLFLTMMLLTILLFSFV